jgi:hypothetical protein
MSINGEQELPSPGKSPDRELEHTDAGAASAFDSGERDDPPTLIAYKIAENPQMPLVPAPSSRSWMDATPTKFANRCLPLLIANQSGWFILNSHEFRATWNGCADNTGVRIEYLKGSEPHPVSCHFGHGILTWTLPYLFRTTPGYNLLVRGPANMLKAGVYPLEGVVETDWSVASFTMNWKLLQLNVPVTFVVGEPICMLVPQRRGELEAFRAEIRTLDPDSEMARQHDHWAQGRARFLTDLTIAGSVAQRRGWEKDYYQGRAPGEARARGHQVKLELLEFVDRQLRKPDPQ